MDSFHKLCRSDDFENILGDHIDCHRKKGRYWMLTLYEKDYTDFSLSGYMGKLQNIENIDSIIGQIEIGEKSRLKHMHLGIIMNDGDFRPVLPFERLFNVFYCSNDRVDIYTAYCCKDRSFIGNKVNRDKWVRPKMSTISLSKPKVQLVIKNRETKENASKEDHEQLKKLIEEQKTRINILVTELTEVNNATLSKITNLEEQINLLKKQLIESNDHYNSRISGGEKAHDKLNNTVANIMEVLDIEEVPVKK